MILTTQRTILRPFRESDLSDLYAYCSQPGVGEMAGWKHHTDIRESEHFLLQNVENPDLFAIEYRKTGRVVGHIAVHKDSENGREDTKELGFVLNQQYQNQGIMTEVVLKMLGHLFSCGVKSVYACCFQNNLPSRKLIEKCGFTLEQEGVYSSKPLNQTFLSFEYVYRRADWEMRGASHA